MKIIFVRRPRRDPGCDSKEEFIVKELESQRILFIISKSSILIYYSTIFLAVDKF